MPPLVEILLVQWVTSIAFFGFFRRPLSAIERTSFYVLTVLGYWALVTEAIHSTFVFVGAATAILALVALRRPAATGTEHVATHP